MLSSTVLTFSCLYLLRPLLVRYALARPTHRSSHRIPTPQGAGIGVIGVAVVVTFVAAGASTDGIPGAQGQLAAVLLAAGSVAAVGFADDLFGVRPSIKLLFQLAFAAVAVASIPANLSALPLLPVWIERAGLVIGLVWLINAWNFMDGLDWMTVAETVPITVTVALLGLVGAVPPYAAVASAALAGAVIGFAPWNRPVARLFLGDAGSLAIGLLVGWLMVLLAVSGFVAAALLLPLYYVADATTTLVRRIVRRQRVWEAHRTHHYQQATDNGFTVIGVVGRVFAVNAVLSVLAVLTIVMPSVLVQAACLAAGTLLVMSLLLVFSTGRR